MSTERAAQARFMVIVGDTWQWTPFIFIVMLAAIENQPRDQVEAAHEYDAWRQLREAGQALDVGDLLETAEGRLSICKYVGFEPAQWVLPEPKTQAEPETAGQSAGS